jgi:hypothetical protein
VVEGEYTAAAIAFGIVISAFFLSHDVEWLRALNIFPLVSGEGYVNKDTFLFSDALPWSTIFASLSVAGLMVLASIAIIQRKEF